MSVESQIDTVYFDVEEATALYEASSQVPEPATLWDFTKVAFATITRTEKPARRFTILPAHPDEHDYDRSNPIFTETYVALNDGPDYYAGIPMVHLQPVEENADEVEAVHYVSARNVSNLYLGVHHKHGQEAAHAFADTTLSLDSLTPTNLLTQFYRLKQNEWQRLSDGQPTHGQIIDASIAALNGYGESARVISLLDRFENSGFGADTTLQVKQGLVDFMETVDPLHQPPYLLRRDGWDVLQPRVKYISTEDAHRARVSQTHLHDEIAADLEEKFRNLQPPEK